MEPVSPGWSVFIRSAALRRRALTGSDEMMMLLPPHASLGLWDLYPHAPSRPPLAPPQTATGHMEQLCDSKCDARHTPTNTRALVCAG